MPWPRHLCSDFETVRHLWKMEGGGPMNAKEGCSKFSPHLTISSLVSDKLHRDTRFHKMNDDDPE